MLREILDQIPVGVLITDKDLNVIWCNNACLENESATREELIGISTRDLYSVMNPNLHGRVLKSQQPLIEEHYSFRDSKNRQVHSINNSYPFTEKGEVKYLFTLSLYLNYVENYFAGAIEYKRKLESEKDHLARANGTRYTFYSILYQSRQMHDLVTLARKISVNDSAVFISGETGTGKEIFAQGIHNAGLNSESPFIGINCAAIPETLLESLLFGSQKGSYTGAETHAGLFEQAGRGTLFLDEIDSMGAALQSKLLRVLQERVVRRIGDNRDRKIRCRFISAAGKGNGQEQTGLRKDLFYRLAPITLRIPPLRERKEDIPILASHFIKKFNTRFGLHVKSLDKACRVLLVNHDWEGNVRELENCIEYAMNMVPRDEESLIVDHLPGFFKQCDLPPPGPSLLEKAEPDSSSMTLKELLHKTEQEHVTRILTETRGNISQAAKRLGIRREALYYRIKKLSIDLAPMK